MRSQAQIDAIKSRITDPYSIDSFLTNSEVLSLIELFEKTKEGKIHKNTGPITLDLPKDNPLINDILSRIAKHIGPFDVTAAFFFYTNIPHIIHNDDTFELPDGVSKAITLPLKINRILGNELPKLCFFDQFYFHGPAKFFNGSKDIPTYYNKCIYEYSDVDGIVDTTIFDDGKLLTHLRPQWLKGLSLHSSLTWVPTSALIFDSTRLHCASDFKRLNIQSKLGISIFTKI